MEVNGNESYPSEASTMTTTNTTSNTIARIDRRLNIIYLARLGQPEIGGRRSNLAPMEFRLILSKLKPHDLTSRERRPA